MSLRQICLIGACICFFLLVVGLSPSQVKLEPLGWLLLSLGLIL